MCWNIRVSQNVSINLSYLLSFKTKMLKVKRQIWVIKGYIGLRIISCTVLVLTRLRTNTTPAFLGKSKTWRMKKPEKRKVWWTIRDKILSFRFHSEKLWYYMKITRWKCSIWASKNNFKLKIYPNQTLNGGFSQFITVKVSKTYIL